MFPLGYTNHEQDFSTKVLFTGGHLLNLSMVVKCSNVRHDFARELGQKNNLLSFHTRYILYYFKKHATF